MRSAKQKCELCQLILETFDIDSDRMKGRESFFHLQLYCCIADPFANEATFRTLGDGYPGHKKGGCSAFWVYWNEHGDILLATNLGIYIERSLIDLSVF